MQLTDTQFLNTLTLVIPNERTNEWLIFLFGCFFNRFSVRCHFFLKKKTFDSFLTVYAFVCLSLLHSMHRQTNSDSCFFPSSIPFQYVHCVLDKVPRTAIEYSQHKISRYPIEISFRCCVASFYMSAKSTANRQQFVHHFGVSVQQQIQNVAIECLAISTSLVKCFFSVDSFFHFIRFQTEVHVYLITVSFDC